MIYFFRRFKGSGFRMTLARDEIYKLLQRERHLSAEEIYFEIHKNYPNIGIATVYRTLNLLTDFGVIKRREFGDGKARYEISEIEHHHHLFCTSCGRIIEYKDFMEEEVEFLKKLEGILSEKYEFEIKDHLINFYGLCKECKNYKERR